MTASRPAASLPSKTFFLPAKISFTELNSIFIFVLPFFTPLEIMPRSVSSPAIAGLEFLTGQKGIYTFLRKLSNFSLRKILTGSANLVIRQLTVHWTQFLDKI